MINDFITVAVVVVNVVIIVEIRNISIDYIIAIASRLERKFLFQECFSGKIIYIFIIYFFIKILL